jgi:adenylate kinase family enzyme
MLNIKDSIKTLFVATVLPEQAKPLKYAIIIDISGSTDAEFVPGMKVLEKEIDVISQFMLSKPDNTYTLYSFSSSAQMHPITIMKEEMFVNMPNFVANGGTYTHLPLLMVNTNPVAPDIVLLLTDGETHSSQLQLEREVKMFMDKKVRFEIVAVSTTNIDMNKISQAEESRIPGMDLINYLSNSIDKLTIFNKFHKDEPYIGATSSTIDKKRITFMGHKVDDFVPKFIDKVLGLLQENQKNSVVYDWGANQIFFKQFLSEIGKLLSVLFMTYQEEHFYVNKIVSTIFDTCGVENATPERISNIIKYGFECTRNKTPILYTNFDQHVKDKAVKHAEFADAVNELKAYGTPLNAEKCISLINKGVCVINKNKSMVLKKMLGTYPNSQDDFGNSYFGCDCSEQAIRIGMREFCATQGFPNARGSPNVIFYILNQMSLMCIKGCDMNAEYMRELRKLAIAQTSMENMISQGKYSGVGFYAQWKAGKSVPMHFSSPKIHSSLYTDRQINPIQLSEPLWWALMMSMLGIFNEQLNYYNTALEQIGVLEGNEQEFHKYLAKEYGSKVEGKVEFVTLDKLPNSVFTLEEFEPTDSVFFLKPHNGCSTNTHYSKQEIDDYVMNHGCVWCHYIPTQADFVKVDVKKQPYVLVKEAMEKASPLKVFGNTIQHFETNLVTEQSGTKKIRINMVGVTGAGKSTAAEKIVEQVTQKGGKCLVVSSDKWSKAGIGGKKQQEMVHKEISDFDKLQADLKVIIVDTCNESGTSPICFGFNLVQYKTFDFYPNLKRTKFDDYECWCLNNVLNRSIHTKDTNFWLNPVSAGINTCIKVHNAKASKLKSYLGLGKSKMFNEALSMEEIKKVIEEGVKRYAEELAKDSFDTEISKFLEGFC